MCEEVCFVSRIGHESFATKHSLLSDAVLEEDGSCEKSLNKIDDELRAPQRDAKLIVRESRAQLCPLTARKAGLPRTGKEGEFLFMI